MATVDGEMLLASLISSSMSFGHPLTSCAISGREALFKTTTKVRNEKRQNKDTYVYLKIADDTRLNLTDWDLEVDKTEDSPMPQQLIQSSQGSKQQAWKKSWSKQLF